MTTHIHHHHQPAANASVPLLRAALGLAVSTLLVFGFIYSFTATQLGGWLFPEAAAGSLIVRDGRVVGSSLVAQPFSADQYFQPRPSAASYDVMALAGSNQARSNPELRARLEQDRASVAAREGVPVTEVPSDLITRSGGGIDPHISAEAAAIQVQRVARARGLTPQQVSQVVAEHTQGLSFGRYGQVRVNVLELNLALDTLAPPPPRK